MSDKLSTWINEQIEKNGWSIREFSRRVGISHTHAARIANGEVIPSAEICTNIAKVFKANPEAVFVYAGLLPSSPVGPGIRELTYLYDQLKPEDQETALTILRGYVREKLQTYPKKQNAET